LEPEDRTVDELLLVVGPERERRTAEEVADAEAQLRQRATEGAAASLRHLRWAGLMAAAIGPVVMLASPSAATLLLTTMTLPLLAGMPSAFIATLLWLLPGPLLIVGGIAVRGRREWARMVVVLGAWGALAVTILRALLHALPLALAAISLEPELGLPTVGAALMLAPLLAAMAFGPLLTVPLLFLLACYFSSPSAKALCRPAGLSGAECRLRQLR
jgi:hypothetical protein